MAFIETDRLGKRDGDQVILDGISIAVEKGQVFTVIGPTGAGKTTLLYLLDLLTPPSAGRIYFDGVDVTAHKRARFEARRRMAFVLQKPALFTASLYDNVACGLRWRGVERGKIRRAVDELLELVDLAAYRGRDVRTLSGGEVQRAALARAMAIGPELLLLDEPTANLDPRSTERIEALITEIVLQYRTTTIMATHDMAQGQRLSDTMGVLMGGRLEQTGGWSDVARAPQNRQVAEFIGIENMVDGVIVATVEGVVTVDAGGQAIEAVSERGVGEQVCACIRAEDITLALSQAQSSARNSFPVKITKVIIAGPLAWVKMDGGLALTALVTKRSAERLQLAPGTGVYATFKATQVHLVPRETAPGT